MRHEKTKRRDADAAKLRLRGHSYQHIADQLGFASPGGAHDAVSRSLAESVRVPFEQQRELALNQLDQLACERRLADPRATIGSTTSAAPATPAQSVGGSDSTPAAAPTYTLSITGSAKKSSIQWGVDGSSGSADQSTPIPWTKTMTAGSGESFHSVTLSANTYPGTAGDLTCTITDQSGKVLDTKSAASQGGEFGSADVMCSASGS